MTKAILAPGTPRSTIFTAPDSTFTAMTVGAATTKTVPEEMASDSAPRLSTCAKRSTHVPLPSLLESTKKRPSPSTVELPIEFLPVVSTASSPARPRPRTVTTFPAIEATPWSSGTGGRLGTGLLTLIWPAFPAAVFEVQGKVAIGVRAGSPRTTSTVELIGGGGVRNM